MAHWSFPVARYRLSRPAFLHNVWLPKDSVIEWDGTPSVFWLGLDAAANSKLAAEVARIKKLNPETGDNGIGPIDQLAVPPSWPPP